MKNNKNFLLRIITAIILLIHGLGGMFNGGINDFGEYLNIKGFAPVGVLLAWIIKLSHVITAVCLLTNKWILWTCSTTIAILIMGIVMVHWQEGWFVVGGGRNGIEFNILLIVVFVTIMFPEGIKRNSAK